MPRAKVFLVGAGPGDPRLITLRGLQALREADVVVYDRLANPLLLQEARQDAELINVGKSSGRHTMSQDEINALLVQKAREEKTVCRLKGGDPFVFGRGGEEALALAEAGVPFEIVPGVTAGVAAPAYAGIPVTHRGKASSVAFVTGHEDPTKGQGAVDWRRLATAADTIVVYMGVGRLGAIVAELLAGGRQPTTPAALVQSGTLPKQRAVVATLGEIEQRAAGIEPPAVLVVGEVAALRETLRWFEDKPLFGRAVVVTRPRHLAGRFRRRLEDLGAEVVPLPTIRIEPPEDPKPLLEAIERLEDYSWVVFTSVNGVEKFFERLFASGRDCRSLCRVAAIGPATAAALASRGIRADCQPAKFTAASLAEEMARAEPLASQRVLLPRVADAPTHLRDALAAQGATVDEVEAYRTVLETTAEASVVERVAAGEVDYVTLTSSSTVRGLAAVVGRERLAGLSRKVRVVSIGPVTTATARELGVEVAAEAEVHTTDGLLATLLRLERSGGA